MKPYRQHIDIVTIMAVDGGMANRLDDYLSTRQLGFILAKALKTGYELVAVDIAMGTIGFYAGSEVRNPGRNQPLKFLMSQVFWPCTAQHDTHGIPTGCCRPSDHAEMVPRLDFDGYMLYKVQAERMEKPTRLLEAKTE